MLLSTSASAQTLPPEVDAALARAKVPRDAVSFLVVDAQGALFLNDQPITPEALRQRLSEAARRNPDTELELRADQSVPYGRVVEVIGLAQQAGLNRVGFVAEPGAAASTP